MGKLNGEFLLRHQRALHVVVRPAWRILPRTPYFGTDVKVQRYPAGGSLLGSRFGLLFNAVLKVPMQFLILLTGVMVFVFFQFEKPPMFFNQPAYEVAAQNDHAALLPGLQGRYDSAFAQKQSRQRELTGASKPVLRTRRAPKKCRALPS
jgi:hypothetical protein